MFKTRSIPYPLESLKISYFVESTWRNLFSCKYVSCTACGLLECPVWSYSCWLLTILKIHSFFNLWFISFPVICSLLWFWLKGERLQLFQKYTQSCYSRATVERAASLARSTTFEMGPALSTLRTTGPVPGDNPQKCGWRCAACFWKRLPYFRPKHVIFPTLFQTWTKIQYPISDQILTLFRLRKLEKGFKIPMLTKLYLSGTSGSLK